MSSACLICIVLSTIFIFFYIIPAFNRYTAVSLERIDETSINKTAPGALIGAGLDAAILNPPDFHFPQVYSEG